jgi:hypothetical protein
MNYRDEELRFQQTTELYQQLGELTEVSQLGDTCKKLKSLDLNL